MAQLETGAAGTAHFEPGGVVFWDGSKERPRRCHTPGSHCAVWASKLVHQPRRRI